MQNVMQALYLTRNARGLPASARRYIGHSLYTELEIMVKELQEKYNGISLKALIVALRDAHSKTKDRGALPDGMTV